MICKTCGQEIADAAVVCPFCGAAVAQQPAVNDTGSFGWAVLGFFFPLIGLILYCVWKKDRPLSAKKAGIGALVGFVLGIVGSIILNVAAAGLMAAMY